MLAEEIIALAKTGDLSDNRIQVQPIHHATELLHVAFLNLIYLFVQTVKVRVHMLPNLRLPKMGLKAIDDI